MSKDQTLTLPSGIEISFRVITPDDAPALQRFHARCSERTIYLRFFGSMEELPDQKARYFASTDGVDHFALVALDPQDPDELIAVVRYDREPGDERAEYAALVEDRWQGQGAGLTRLLIDEAKDKGVRFFYALVMGKNKSARTAASRVWRSNYTPKKPDELDKTRRCLPPAGPRAVTRNLDYSTLRGCANRLRADYVWQLYE